MDNLCHTLTGAALGHAGLAGRTRYGMATLLIASNLPDVDVAVFLTDTLPVSFRRGWTHGVVGQALLPLAFAGLMWLMARRGSAVGEARPAETGRPATLAGPRDVRFDQLLLLSYVAFYAHLVMDYLNSYGLRLLMPLSGRWFYGDALYIVDPWIWLVLGIGVWLSARAARRARARPWRPARMAAVVVAAYCVLMLGSNLWARQTVKEGLTRAGRAADTRFMVTPVFANPFRREVLVDTGERYEKGQIWFEPVPHFRPLGYGVDKGFEQPGGAAALATPRAQAYLRWSRFPFIVVDRSVSPPRVFLNDYRYSDAGGRAGWAGLRIELGTMSDNDHQEVHEGRVQ